VTAVPAAGARKSGGDAGHVFSRGGLAGTVSGALVRLIWQLTTIPPVVRMRQRKEEAYGAD